jgi:transposase
MSTSEPLETREIPGQHRNPIFERHRIRHVIPERSGQQARRAAKGPRGGRPPDFDKEAYKQRNVVERCFSRLKQWRDLATRYAKRAVIYRASLVLISAIIWLQ